MPFVSRPRKAESYTRPSGCGKAGRGVARSISRQHNSLELFTMTKPFDPADWLLEHTPAELDEAVGGFANAAMKYKNSLGEDSQDQDLSLWMHPDFFTWAVYGCAMGISDGESMVFFGFRLQEPFLKGNGNFYQFSKP